MMPKHKVSEAEHNGRDGNATGKQAKLAAMHS